MPDPVRIARGAAVAAGIVAYAVLMHRVNVAGVPSLQGALLVLAPLFLIGFALMRRARLAGLLLLIGCGLLLWLGWPWLAQHSGALFWLQDMALLLTLFFTFARTLVGGRTPLCVIFAEAMHGPLTPAHARYAQRVTMAWASFFLVLALLSTGLFLFTPLAVWSLYVNFAVLPLVALMFVAEYTVRRRVLVDVPSGRLLDAFQAYLKSTRSHG